MNRFSRARSRKQKGFLLAIVLIALIVVSLITAAMIQTLVDHHRQIKFAERRQQAEWLALAANDRAAISLAKANDYAGEIWKLPTELTAAESPREAHIRIERGTGNPSQSIVHVTIYASRGQIQRVLYQSQRSIKLPSPGGSS